MGRPPTTSKHILEVLDETPGEWVHSHYIAGRLGLRSTSRAFSSAAYRLMKKRVIEPRFRTYQGQGQSYRRRNPTG